MAKKKTKKKADARTWRTAAEKVAAFDDAAVMGVAAACKKHGVPMGSFYNWRAQEAKLRSAARAAAEPAAPAPASRIQTTVFPPKAVSPLAPLAQSPPLELVVKGFGPWLEQFVRQALPDIVRPLVEARLRAEVAAFFAGPVDKAPEKTASEKTASEELPRAAE